MHGLGDSDSSPDREASAAEAVSQGSPGLLLQACRSRTQSPESVTSSTSSIEADSEISGGDEQDCFYLDHLVSRHLHIDEDRDYFLQEHLSSCRLNPCRPLSASAADEIVQAAPIREEIPFDQIHCLQPVNLRDELLGPRHIRLLKLYPMISTTLPSTTRDGRECPQLRCEAYQACLDDLTTNGRPLFAAASYVCGDQTPARRILCGSNGVDIPQNACDVLSHLRFKHRPRLIWIDHLCIRQDDDREKSHQVGMLHTIYAQAHVVSWLGMGREIDLQSLSFYLFLSARLWIDEVRENKRNLTAGELGFKARGRLETFLDSQAKVLPHRYSLQALASIFSTEYFNRVWIVQEIILGKTNIFQLGNELYPLAVLAAAADVLQWLDTTQPTATNPECIFIDAENIEQVSFYHLVPALHNCWRQIGDWQLHDVDVVTSLNRGCCLDPRDHIYGVASLFQDSDGYEFDYTLSEAEVFADFTVHCLMRYQTINLLNQDRPAMESISARSDLRVDLPSWCPDWSVAGGGNDVLFEEHGFSWQASGRDEMVSSRPSRTTLALKGLVVSTLKLCSDSIINYLGSSDDGELRGPWFDHSEKLRAFFEFQGLQIDHAAKTTIFRIFERILPPDHLKHGSWDKGTSLALCPLLDQVQPSDLVALLAPVYLAAVDPELFRVLRLEIDARLPLEDYPHIRYFLGQMISRYGKGSRLFVAENNMQGAGYPGVRQGDLVCIVYGSDVPQILRRTDGDDGEHYILVGACNVDGLMYGEGLEMGLAEREFILV